MRLAVLVALMLGCGNSSQLPDGPIGAEFACGTMTCTAATQFCYLVAVGRERETAPAATVGCNSLPPGCGTPATCACVMATETFSCANTPECAAQGSDVTVSCNLP